ncbi:MAG: hypothetical protein KBD19_04970 [Candidatus Moranbacteria bacterium]|nr:hypothetical protein [Candidatus Moranbacteria bacterium]
MAIKRMLFPLFVIILAFVAVNFIRPAVLAVLEEHAEKDVKLAELSAIEKTATNIGSLSASRETLLASADGRLIMSYLPIGHDHDRIVDILNFLALQTGAVISDVSFEAGSVPPAAVPQEGVVAPDGTIVETAPQVPLSSTFGVSVEMSGSYESLKSFMDKVASVDRLKKVTSFSITEQEAPTGSPSVEDGQTVVDDGTLSAMLSAEFAYLPESSYPGAHLLPIFSSGSFDVESVKQSMTSDELVPALPEPVLSDRRANPFKL